MTIVSKFGCAFVAAIKKPQTRLEFSTSGKIGSSTKVAGKAVFVAGAGMSKTSSLDCS
jgi:hypothetical protein